MNSPIQRYLIALLLLFCDRSALADSLAVQTTNAQAGFTSRDTYAAPGRVDYGYDFTGRITLPLATYLGASFSGAYNHTNLAVNLDSNLTSASALTSCAVDGNNLGAELFVRNPDYGKVSIGYGTGRQKSHCDATYLLTGTNILDTSGPTLSAEYYFSNITVAASRTQTHLGPNAKLDSDSLSLGWYPSSNARLSLSTYGLDLRNTNKLSLEYRPDFLDDSMSLLLSYSTQRLTTKTNALLIGFDYFFDKRVTLITRDRHYR